MLNNVNQLLTHKMFKDKPQETQQTKGTVGDRMGRRV
jgi:hypothetical protein